MGIKADLSAKYISSNINNQKLKQSKFLFFAVFLAFWLISFFMSSTAEAQRVPRVGFPYCQSFDGTAGTLARFGDLRYGGDFALTEYSARLTPNEENRSGYFYIDIPFSPQNGIQASFEYLIYGGSTTTSLGADGISFFMFDGKFGDGPGFDPFGIGGKGGALGYASRETSRTDLYPLGVVPGLTGGYIGLGLDVWGNYISKEENFLTERKQTGRSFQAPPAGFLSAAPYPQTVGVRGPAALPINYDVVDAIDVFTTFGQTLDTETLVLNCDDPNFENYRKVYLSLEPLTPPFIGYEFNVKIKFGSVVENIFTIPYPHEAPETIKLGFAAATGSKTNFHEIRNLAVGIFEPDLLRTPLTENAERRACEGDPVEFELELDRLLRDSNSFIQCIQLYQEESDVPDPTFQDNEEEHLVCGIADICNTCINVDYAQGLEKSGFGTFYVDIDTEIDILNPQDDKVVLRFEPLPKSIRQINEGSIFYTITDNYGITSLPAEFKVIINPIPSVESGSLEFSNPTCDGQDDGRIKVNVENLVDNFTDDFTYEWKFYPPGVDVGAISDADLIANPGLPLPGGASQAESPVAPGTWQFSLENISLGSYVLVVGNPSSDGFCYEVLRVTTIDDETGIPIDVSEDLVICEGADVVIVTDVEDKFINGLLPVYIWYASNDRSSEIVRSPSSVTISGITYDAGSDGTLKISGLTSESGNAKDYEFFVELKEDRANPRSLCSNVNLLYSATVKVFPSVTFSPEVKIDDWCLENFGSISIQANRGNEQLSIYFLLDADQNTIRGPQANGVFEDLGKGTYFVRAESAFPTCEATTGPIRIEGPDKELEIVVDSSNPACQNNDGWIEWEVSEGNGNYSLVSITGYPGGILPTVTQSGTGIFRIDNLPYQDTFYTVTIIVQDEKGCKISSSREIQPQILPVYSINDGEICIDEDISILPGVPVVGFPDPQTIFRWYSNPEATTEITTGINAAIGATFEIDNTTGRISISDFQNDGTYTFYLKPQVVNNCDVPAIPVIVQVNPLPSPIFEERDLKCFQAADGQLVLTGGGQSEYSYVLDGSSITFNGTSFDGLVAGDYEIVATNNVTGCSIRLPFNLEQPDLLVLEKLDFVNPSCGLNNGQIEFRFSGGTGEYELFLNNSSIKTYASTEAGQIFSLTDIAGGGYILGIKDENDCTQEFPFTLIPDDFPEFDVTDDVICEINAGDPSRPFYVATVSPVFNLSTAVPVYSWFYKDDAGTEVQVLNGSTVFGATASINASSELSLQGLAAASDPYLVYLKVTGDNVCDNSLIPAAITVNPLPTPIFLVEDASCFGKEDGKLVLESGGTADYDYDLVNNSAAFDGTAFKDLPAGTYTIRVTNTVTTCFDDFELTINQPEVLEIEEVELVDPTCDLDNGTYRFQIKGGTGPFEVFLEGQAVEVYESGQSDPISAIDSTFVGKLLEIRNLTGGTFEVSIVDANSCEADDEFTLDPRPIPVFETESTEICEIDPQTRDAVIATVRPVVVELFIAVPTYTWYYLDSAGTELQILNGSTVYGATASINGASELSLQGLAAASDPYEVFLKVTGDNVCDNSLIPATITVNPLPTPVFMVEDVSCFVEADGKLVLESGGTADYDYDLVNNSAAFDGTAFKDLPAGTYTIRVTNTVTTCFDDFELTINQPEVLEIEEVELVDPTCDLDNGTYRFQIKGGTGPFEVFLEGQAVEVYESGQSDPISAIDSTFVGKLLEIRNLTGGTFEVSIVDANSCEADDEFTLDPRPIPVFETESVEICEIDPQTRDAVIATVRPVVVELSNAVPTYTWYYLDSAGTEVKILNNSSVFGATASINGASELSLQGLAAAANPYIIYLKVTGDNVCDNSLIPVDILVYPLPAPIFERFDVSCFNGNDGRLELVSGGSTDFDYVLSDPTVTFDASDQAFIDLSAGSYTVTVTNTTSGCLDTFDFEIQEPDALILSENRGIDATCGVDNGELFFRVVGGTGPYSIFVNDLPIEVYQFFLGAVGIYNVRGLAPGTYSVRVEDVNGCSDEELNWITIQNNEGEIVNAVPDEVTVCEGTPAILKPTVTVSGGVTPLLTWYLDSELTLAIAAGVNADGIEFILLSDGSLEVLGLPVGNYEYFVGISGQNVCTNSSSGTIEVLEPVLADVVATDIVCFGDENGSIQVSNVSGGNSDFEYSLNETAWQDAPLFENLAPGIYTVYVRDKTLLSNCALELPGVEVKSPSGPIISNTPQIFAESCESANGEIFGLVISGGWGNYTHEWRKDNPTNGAVITGTITGIENVEAGTYYLLIEDEKGCSEVFEYLIGTAPDPQYILLDPIDVCEGNPVTLAPLHVAINPNTPTARTDVSWYKGPNQTGLIQDGVDSANPAVSYSIDDSDWLNPKLIVTGLVPGTYTYYFFVECTGVEMPISVTVYPTPAVVIEVSHETCAGENDGKISVISGHQAGYIYKIGQENLTLAQLEGRNFAGGSYSIEVITAEGCNQLLTAEIEAPSALKLELLDSKNAACGLTDGFIEVELAGGWAPYTIELTEVSSSTKTTLTGTDSIYKFENLSQGTYTVTVIDAEQCSITLSNQVTVEDGPSEVLLDDEYFICEGEVLELRPGVNPSNANALFNWYLNSVSVANKLSDGQTVNGAQLSINANGTIFRATGLTPSNDLRMVVTVEGLGICEGDEQEVVVRVLTLPVVSLSKADEVCFGDFGRIILNTSSNSGPLQYSVNGGAFQSYASNIIDNLAQGSYQLQVKNEGNCIVDLPAITIEGPDAALQVQDYGHIGASCEVDNGIIFGEVLGGEAPYLIQIRRAGQLLPNPGISWDDAKFQITDLALGTYEIILEDKRGCEITLGSSTITDEPTPIEVNSVVICEGETAVLTPFIPGVPSSPGYRWYKDAAKTRQIPLGSSQENAVGYELGANGVLRVNSLLANGSPYRYFVELNLAATCDTKLVEANIVVNPLPNLRTFNPSIVCDPTEMVNLTNFIDNFNANIYDYEVTDPSGVALRLDQISAVSQAGTYLVRTKFKNSSCWTGQERILVRITDEEIIANFDYQLDLGSGNLLTNSDIGIEEILQFIDISVGITVAWEWDFGDGTTSTLQNPVHEYKEKGAYVIRLTTYSKIGCISVIERTVNVFDDYLIMFPNAFTPVRPDGKNNFFYPKYRGIASLKLYIFNTWGELIYISESFEQGGWDGTLNSQQVPNGNYVYKAQFTTRSGLKQSKAGVFILVK